LKSSSDEMSAALAGASKAEKDAISSYTGLIAAMTSEKIEIGTMDATL